MERSGAELWPAIGIDLGTTNSCVAIWKHGGVEIIPNAQGSRTTPSCVAFSPSQCLIGDAAKYQVEAHPTNTIYDFKRLIGRKCSDKIVQKDMKLWPFTVIPRKDDRPLIAISYKGEVKCFAPEQIFAMVLAKMKETAEAYMGMEVKNAVVNVPAYFNNTQRQATIDAGTIAGLNVMRIINEPTAAAIAYGHMEHASDSNVKPKNILVFDLGGGTLNVSLVTVAKDSFVVKATSGDTHLGGVDFDNNVVNYFVDEFKIKHNKDINGNRRAVARLRVACEKAKRSLSSITKIPIEIDCLYEGVDLSSTLSRKQFEILNMKLFGKCIKAVQECLSKATMIKHNVDDVVLVGGSTRIPKVQELLKEFFDGKELCKTLNPDEAVAYGAAIQAANLSGIREYQHLLVSDVTPFSLVAKYGISGEEIFQIPRNTRIPTKIEHQFSTVIDDRRLLILKVSALEDINFCDTFFLKDFNTDCGSVSSVLTTYTIDANNILTVTSVEQSYPGRVLRQIMKKIQLTVSNFDSRNLCNNDINMMVEEARKYKMEDMEQKFVRCRCNIKMEITRFEVEMFVNNMSDTLSSYGIIKSTYKKKLKDSIQQTNCWLNLNSQLNDVHMFEDKLKELQDNFTDENRTKEDKESKRKDTKLRKARLDLEKFVNNMSDTLSSYGMIKSTYKKKLKDSIRRTNRWLNLNSQLNDVRMFEDKLKELQDNFTDKNKTKEDKESKRKDELRNARLDLEKFVSNISDNMSNYYNIKFEDKKKLKDVIQETNKWLDLNVRLNDASKFEDKLKELQDICNPSSDASGMPKKSSFLFLRRWLLHRHSYELLPQH